MDTALHGILTAATVTLQVTGSVQDYIGNSLTGTEESKKEGQ